MSRELLAVLLACAGMASCTSISESGLADAAPGDAATPDAAETDAAETDAAEPDAGAPDEVPAQDGEDEGPDAGWFYGTDCPGSAPSSVPPDSPRILILGPAEDAAEISAHLKGILAADSAFTSPVVTGLDIAASVPDGGSGGGLTLMNFFYLPDGRDERLAPLAESWSYVVLIEESYDVLWSPEFYFEGVRVLGCSARAAGAKPIVLMTYTPGNEAAARGEVTYRVANGTNSIVAPAGYAWDEAQTTGSPVWGRDDSFIAAATLYSTLTGRDAGATSYRPAGIPPDQATQLATIAFDTVESEAGRVHYDGACRGMVEMREVPPGGDFWFMDSGTSSEQIWYDRMVEILPRAGLTPQGTQIGYTNPHKTFDDACLDIALPYFEDQQYQILFARGYEIDAVTITTAGAQTDLQVQIWDRHADAYPSDGIMAVEMLEAMSNMAYSSAKALGLVLIPYHLMFAKLKTMRPSVQLLGDGIHATYPVGYGLATMSVVSRTGIHPSTDGLDPDTLLAAQLAEETIRQLSALSVSGEFIPDDPSARPAP